jgi:hypothetical protein
MTFSLLNGELRELCSTVALYEIILLYARSDFISPPRWVTPDSPNSPFKGIKKGVLLTPLFEEGST